MNCVRCISGDGAVAVTAVDTKEIVSEARRIHSTSNVCTAALGRLLTGASLMGSEMKGKDDSLTLRINGGGPAGTLIAVSDSGGNVRGYIGDPGAQLPLRSDGKLDVGGVVGKNGTLTVIRDLGLKEPVTGNIPLVSGEIAEDITSYYAVSEQLPTVCALGVLIKPDGVAAAGGFMVHLLPGADDETLTKVEDGLKELRSVTSMLSLGMSPADICRAALPRFELEELMKFDVSYRCACTRERVENALISTGRKELEEMAAEGGTSVRCNFCGREYAFTGEQIEQLISR